MGAKLFLKNSTGQSLKNSSGQFIYKSLPAAYQEVEYIANANGSQYIDLSYIPNYTNGFSIEIYFKPSATGYRYCLMSNYDSGEKQLSLELNASNKARLYLNSGALDKTTTNTFSTSTFNSVVYVYKSSSYQIVLNGTALSGSYSVTGASTASLRLFLDRAGRSSTFSKPISIGQCKIRDGETLVSYLIPCYRKSDSVIGMYDLVNNQFYINAGSGTFTKGSNID